jgi:hypothetical protein
LQYLAVYDPWTETLDPRALPGSRAIPPPRILSDKELGVIYIGMQSGIAKRTAAGPDVDDAGGLAGEHPLAFR